jgi:hypothetical protein
MVRRCAFAAEIETAIGNHAFRATGITAYLKNGGTLERAATMANHASSRTTQLHDRRCDDVMLDEVRGLWRDNLDRREHMSNGGDPTAFRRGPAALEDIGSCDSGRSRHFARRRRYAKPQAVYHRPRADAANGRSNRHKRVERGAGRRQDGGAADGPVLGKPWGDR